MPLTLLLVRLLAASFYPASSLDAVLEHPQMSCPMSYEAK